MKNNKITILTQGFLETTLSIAHYLAKLNLDVNVICINYSNTRKLNVFDFNKYFENKDYISKEDIKSISSSEFIDYISGFDLNFYFFKRNKFNPLELMFNGVKMKKIIEKSNPDVINIIQGSPFLQFIAYLLPKEKIVYSLHEIINHFGETSKKQKVLLNFIIKNKFPVIVFSNTSKKRFIEYINNQEISLRYPIHVINFGLFEIYRFFNIEHTSVSLNINDKLLNKKIILFYGRITPDKGLEILLSTYSIIEKQFNDVFLIIAGAGKIEYDFSNIKNILVFNRHLTNEEIVYFNKIAYVTICPYLSASQSGIPMTTYLFNKPIIASDVGAFPEFIYNMSTGLIIQPNNITSLKDAIVNILTDEDFYNSLINAIKTKYSTGDFDWNLIAKKTLLVYNKYIIKDSNID